MPIQPVDKVWMNGQLVDWDNATVHVLTHALHYGTGVFEGIRCYETPAGPGRLPAAGSPRSDGAIREDLHDGDPVLRATS